MAEKFENRAKKTQKRKTFRMVSSPSISEAPQAIITYKQPLRGQGIIPINYTVLFDTLFEIEYTEGGETFDGETVRAILESMGHDPLELDKRKRAFRHDWKTKIVISGINSLYPDVMSKKENVIKAPHIWDELAMTASEMFALQKAYIACLEVKRAPPDLLTEKAAAIFKLLFYADKTMKSYEESLKRYFKDSLSETLDKYLHNEKHGHVGFALIMPVFPLIEQYRAFMLTSPASVLEDKYGTYNTPRVKLPIHFWENRRKSALNAMVDALQRFQHDLHESGCEWESYTYDPVQLAILYIRVMDYHVNLNMRNTAVLINGAGKEVEVYMRTATPYAWLVPKLAEAGTCRICPRCKKPFKVGSQKNQKYCSRHNKNDREYMEYLINGKAVKP